MILVIYDDLIDEAQLFVDNRYLIRLCMGKWANKKGIVVKMFCTFTSACWYFSVVKVKGEKDDGEKKSLYVFFLYHSQKLWNGASFPGMHKSRLFTKNIKKKKTN